MRLLPIWFGYPFADISYWVGLVFTLGCVAWVINGHYALFESGGAVARNAEQALTVSAAAALVGGALRPAELMSSFTQLENTWFCCRAMLTATLHTNT